MSYKKAEEVLPKEIIELIQKYVDGENIYIPRKTDQRRQWGQKTSIRQELRERNKEIYKDYSQGFSIQSLAEKYYLSEKSIQRVLHDQKYRNEEAS